MLSIYIILLNLLCLFDTYIKYHVISSIKYNIYKSNNINIYIQIVYNNGFAFGIHTASNLSLKIILHIIAVGIIGIMYYWIRNIYILATLFASCYNLFDRVKYGYIIDYIHINSFRFNLVDIIISINLIMLIKMILLG